VEISVRTIKKNLQQVNKKNKKKIKSMIVIYDVADQF